MSIMKSARPVACRSNARSGAGDKPATVTVKLRAQRLRQALSRPGMITRRMKASCHHPPEQPEYLRLEPMTFLRTDT